MKKITLIIAVTAVILCFYAALPAAETKAGSMRVVVEGEEEAKLPHDAPVILTRTAVAAKRISAADIKALAAKSDLENEVMDSVISKMSDMEDDIRKQKLYNMVILVAFIMLFGMVYFTRRKK